MFERVACSITALGFAMTLTACGDRTLPENEGYGPNPTLPAPSHSWLPTINVAKAVGWQTGESPTVAHGFKVNSFAANLDHPRWLYELPNGDVLVAESNAPPKPEGKSDGLVEWVRGLFMARAGAKAPSANRITLLRDSDGDGIAELKTAFLQNLRSPFGMALVGDQFYVANADAVVRFNYQLGQTRIEGAPTKVADLPAGRNHHWTKSMVASEDGTKLYVGVGSNSNVGENGMNEETERASVLEIDLPTGQSRVFATGLRNPVGIDWNPTTKELWVAVNERDELGNDLVPDYMTSVKRDAFYGWPYSYYGQNVDSRPEPKRPDLVAKAVKPDYALGSHTASLGLTFEKTGQFAAGYQGGAFVGQHGSWNRKPPSGYRVIYIPFANGKPNGLPREILTGFLNDAGEARGRPVGVHVDRKGALLVADDVGNVIWRVSSAAK